MIKNSKTPQLVDPFDRKVSYLRLSVTDRCDLRCVYCMAENMTFLPRKDLLTIEELYRVSVRTIELGINKIRITGGEPLVRRNIMQLFAMLAPHINTPHINTPHINNGLDELTLTTNGTLLSRYADALYSYGVRRVNISLDTLNPTRYQQVTRLGCINKVFAGIDAALKAGLKVKINSVAMTGGFLDEVDRLIDFCHSRNMDLTLIEEMPMGDTGHDRFKSHLSLKTLQEKLEQNYTLIKSNHATGGPARYYTIKETGGRIGFITPLSCDFCSQCNRIRIGSTGKLYPCMGQAGMVELRHALRQSESDEQLTKLIYQAIMQKPKGHDFAISHDESQNGKVTSGSITGGLSRHMSELGG